jgi:O-antigen/teichoic acid export membrane protein/glycosyltransferase involved in cell wall biosynthesis
MAEDNFTMEDQGAGISVKTSETRISETASKPSSHWPISLLSGISSIFNTLMPLLIARFFTPEEYGIFKIFFLYLILLPAFSLTYGLTNGLAFWAGKQHEKKVSAFKASWTLLSGLVILSTILISIFQEYLAAQLNWSSFTVVLFILSVACQIMTHFLEESFIVTGRIWTGALFYSGFEILRTLAILSFAFIFRSINAVIIAHTILSCTKAALGLSLGVKYKIVGITSRIEELKPIIKYAFPVSLAGIFSVFVPFSDQFVLSSYLNNGLTYEDIARYSVGCLSLQPLYIIEQSITRVTIPHLSELFSNKENRKAAEAFKNCVAQIAFLIIPAVFGLVLFYEQIIVLLFSTKYASSAQYLQLYALSYLNLIIPFDTVARAHGRSGWILKNYMAFSILSLANSFLFFNLFGIYGLLYSVLISQFLMRASGLLFTLRLTNWKLSECIPFSKLSSYICVCGILSLAALLAKNFFIHGLTWFLVCGSLFGFFYLFINLIMSNKELHASSQQTHADTNKASSNTINILTIVQSLHIGGIERMIFNLLHRIRMNEQFQSCVFAYDHLEKKGTTTLLGKFNEEKILTYTYKKRKGFSPIVIAKIVKIIFDKRITILHVHDLGGLIYAAFAKFLTFKRVKILHTQHSFIHLGMEKKYSSYERFFSKFADKITVVSGTLLKDYAALGLDKEKIALIRNGVDFHTAPLKSRAEKLEVRKSLIKNVKNSSLQSALSLYHDKVWLLYLARIYPQKGQDHALCIWKELPDEIRKQSILLFVGPESKEGEMDRIKSIYNRCPDQDHIVFVGATSEPKKWFQTGDLFISASEYDGMPLAPVEAIAAGLPTVLSSIEGHSFLMNYSTQFDYHDYQQGAKLITDNVTNLVSSPDAMLAKFWEQGKILRDEFSIESMCKKYEDVYKAMMSR